MSRLDRRTLLYVLATMALALVQEPAHAKDGESGGGGGGGGGSNSGSGGGDNSGSGSDNDSDSDDRDRDDSRDDDDDRDDDDSSDSSKNSDQEKALRAYKSGKIVPLRKLKAHLRANFPGSIIKIDLKRRSGKYEYSVKLLDKANRVKSITLDGLTLQVRKR